jgi:hypothetical protein
MEVSMAHAKKCDRCGKYYDANSEKDSCTNIVVGVCFAAKLSGVYTEYKDLCDECITKFKRFMDGCELEE